MVAVGDRLCTVYDANWSAWRCGAEGRNDGTKEDATQDARVATRHQYGRGEREVCSTVHPLGCGSTVQYSTPVLTEAPTSFLENVGC